MKTKYPVNMRFKISKMIANALSVYPFSRDSIPVTSSIKMSSLISMSNDFKTKRVLYKLAYKKAM